jgi:putative GTP pyrophosphokinase
MLAGSDALKAKRRSEFVRRGREWVACLNDAETIEKLKAQYKERKRAYDALKQEVVFVLEQALNGTDIKITPIESRVKELDSLLAKCRTKNIADLEDGPSDIVAVRVVTLLRSDLSRLDDVIRSSFDVLKVDDKINARADSFEYMSIHYDCRMKSSYSGPRYVDILDKSFEVQIRTICMHAWAAISHYLDYKTEQDIPLELRKELNALSGLFYVADSQFESAYRARIQSRQEAGEQAQSKAILSRGLDLDSLAAVLAQLYPDRTQPDAAALSTFLAELRTAGIVSIEEIIASLERAKPVVIEYESAHPPSPEDPEDDEGDEQYRFWAIGLARLSMCLTNEVYAKSYRKHWRDDPLFKFASKLQ